MGQVLPAGEKSKKRMMTQKKKIDIFWGGQGEMGDLYILYTITSGAYLYIERISKGIAREVATEIYTY